MQHTKSRYRGGRPELCGMLSGCEKCAAPGIHPGGCSSVLYEKGCEALERGRRALPKSLKDLVYDYLKEELREGRLLPGVTFRLRDISEAVGISTTPLREALVQLQAEGFITLSRGKGAMVTPLSLATIRNIYQMIGALESSVILEVCQKIGNVEIEKMKELNRRMWALLEEKRTDEYLQANRDFHDIFLNLSANTELRDRVEILRQRLYDFPRTSFLVEEWEQFNIPEHERIVDLMERGKFRDAADYLQNVHWSFDVQKRFIVQYYENHVEACQRMMAEMGTSEA